MAGPRKGVGAVLVIVGCVVLAILAISDVTQPDSFLLGLFDSNRDPGSSAREIVETVRGR